MTDTEKQLAEIIALHIVREKQLSDGVKTALQMLDHNCGNSNCTGGAIQIAEDDWEQCQWCDEIDTMKKLVTD